MLKLEALVKPFVLDELLQELLEIGVHSLSYSEVRAANRSLMHEVQGEGTPEDVTFAPHIKLEVILDKAHLSEVENALAAKVATPLVGGMEVTVMRLKDGLRILGSKAGETTLEEI